MTTSPDQVLEELESWIATCKNRVKCYEQPALEGADLEGYSDEWIDGYIAGQYDFLAYLDLELEGWKK